MVFGGGVVDESAVRERATAGVCKLVADAVPFRMSDHRITRIKMRIVERKITVSRRKTSLWRAITIWDQECSKKNRSSN